MRKILKNSNYIKFAIIILVSINFSCRNSYNARTSNDMTPSVHKKVSSANLPTKTETNPYLEFLEEAFSTMEKYYYQPVSRKKYEAFLKKYKETVLAKLPDPYKRIDRIAYVGAGLLVQNLRSADDTFTNFIPPKKAKEYSKKIYGKRQDIGITGHLTDQGYTIDHVQIRSDSFFQGIRANDIILKIDEKDILQFSLAEISELLRPTLESLVELTIYSPMRDTTNSYKIMSIEYFKETLTNIPTSLPNTYCLKIETFNKMTSEDLKEYIRKFKQEGIELLILDIRDNPGGPPLAVQAMSGFFLPPKMNLFYYQKRDTPKFGLRSPESDVHYAGPLVILINGKSGSASEILAGTFKAYKRALVLGKEPTAGRAFLKSTFKLSDQSMIAMVTGMAYLFDGTKFGMNGVNPNLLISPDVPDVLKFVIEEFKNGELLTGRQEEIVPNR